MLKIKNIRLIILFFYFIRLSGPESANLSKKNGVVNLSKKNGIWSGDYFIFYKYRTLDARKAHRFNG